MRRKNGTKLSRTKKKPGRKAKPLASKLAPELKTKIFESIRRATDCPVRLAMIDCIKTMLFALKPERVGRA